MSLADELADFGIDQHDLRLIAESLYENDDDRRESINPALLGRLRSHLRSLADAVEDDT